MSLCIIRSYLHWTKVFLYVFVTIITSSMLEANAHSISSALQQVSYTQLEDKWERMGRN